MRWRRSATTAGLLVLTSVACSGDDGATSTTTSVVVNDALCLDADGADAPVVELIDPGLSVVEELYGGPQRYFEVSADDQRVSIIVATADGAAEQVFYCGVAGRTPPESLGAADGATFPADAIDIDPSSVFDQLDDELADPDIVDFAVVGAGGDDVVYDATVRSESGGILLVRLTADGAVLAVQAR